MRIAIFVTNVAGSYSGGRLASLFLGACLARAGAEVAYVTTAVPGFYDEVAPLAGGGDLQLFVTRDFLEDLPPGRFDHVVLIPTQSRNLLLYRGARAFARRRKARLTLFSFETPNWFNAMAPSTRDEGLWEEWSRALEDGGLVLANSAQSQAYAEAYYRCGGAPVGFDHWRQPVNAPLCDAVRPQYREKRLVAFVRPSDAHKGAEDLIRAMSPALAGWALVLISGTRVDEWFVRAMEQQAAAFGFGLEFLARVSEAAKFVELKRSRGLIFPSYFEGYGLPPLEALTAGAPVVAYDLPVLHEFGEGAIRFVARGDVEGLRAAIARLTEAPAPDAAALRAQVADLADLDSRGRAALAALQGEGRRLTAAGAERTRGRLAAEGASLYDDGTLTLWGEAQADGWYAVEVFADGAPLGAAVVCESRDTPVSPRTGRLADRPAPFGLVRALKDRKAAEVECRLVGRTGVLATATVAVARRAGSPPAMAAGFDCRLSLQRLMTEPEGACVTGWLVRNDRWTGGEAEWRGAAAAMHHGLERPDIQRQLPAFDMPRSGFFAAWALQDADRNPAEEEPVRIHVYRRGEPLVIRSTVPARPARTGMLSPRPRATAGVLPLIRQFRVTVDEHDVLTAQGWVLSVPRVDRIAVHVDGALIGETAPDRLAIRQFELHRQYSDIRCGFQLQHRIAGALATSRAWRVEFWAGDACLDTAEGAVEALAPLFEEHMADYAVRTGRAQAGARSAAVVAHAGHLSCDGAGLALRALADALRQGGREVALVLQASPLDVHELEPDLRAAFDEIYVADPGRSAARFAPLEPDAAPDGPRRALAEVVASLAARPGMEAVAVTRLDWWPALAGVPPEVLRIGLELRQEPPRSGDAPAAPATPGGAGPAPMVFAPFGFWREARRRAPGVRLFPLALGAAELARAGAVAGLALDLRPDPGGLVLIDAGRARSPAELAELAADAPAGRSRLVVQGAPLGEAGRAAEAAGLPLVDLYDLALETPVAAVRPAPERFAGPAGSLLAAAARIAGVPVDGPAAAGPPAGVSLHEAVAAALSPSPPVPAATGAHGVLAAADAALPLSAPCALVVGQDEAMARALHLRMRLGCAGYLGAFRLAGAHAGTLDGAPVRWLDELQGRACAEILVASVDPAETEGLAALAAGFAAAHPARPVVRRLVSAPPSAMAAE